MFLSNISIVIFVITWIHFYEPTKSSAISKHVKSYETEKTIETSPNEYSFPGMSSPAKEVLYPAKYKKRSLKKKNKKGNKTIKKTEGAKEVTEKGNKKIKKTEGAKEVTEKHPTDVTMKTNMETKGYDQEKRDKEFQDNKDLYMNNRDLLDDKRTNLYAEVAGFVRDGMVSTVGGTIVGETVEKIKNSRGFQKVKNFAEKAVSTGVAVKKTYDQISQEANKAVNLIRDTKNSFDKPIQSIKSLLKDGTNLAGRVINTFNGGRNLLSKMSEQTGKIRNMVNTGINTAKKLIQAVQNLNIVAKASSIISAVAKTFKAIASIGKALGSVVAALGPISGIIGGILDIFLPPPNIAKLLEKGFKELTDKMLEQFDNLLNEMHKEFKDLSNLISDGFAKMDNHFNTQEIKVDQQFSANMRLNYIMGIRDDINRVMVRFKEFSKYPADNKTVDSLRKRCSDSNPSATALTFEQAFTEEWFVNAEKIAHGHFIYIQAFLISIAKDASTLNMIVPVCNGLLEEKKRCELNNENSEKMIHIFKRVTSLMRDFDSRSVHALRKQFLGDLQPIIKSYKASLNQAAEKYLVKNVTIKKQDIRVVNFHALKANYMTLKTLSVRQKFADDILDILSQNDDLRFTVIVNFTKLHYERPNFQFDQAKEGRDQVKNLFDIEMPSVDTYISSKVEEKLIVFNATDINIPDMSISIFWYRSDHNPVGPLWESCIEETSGCWYDTKPICMKKGMKVINPMVGKVEMNKAYCTNEKECEITDIHKPPMCNKKKCFEKCSDMAVDDSIVDTKNCFNSEVPCFHNNLKCIMKSASMLDTFFPNDTSQISISDERCIKTGKTYPYIGNFQTPACITNINSDPKHKKENEVELNRAKIKATNLDCRTVFGFPNPTNMLGHLKENGRIDGSVAVSHKKWNFENITEIAEYLENDHEMIYMGYCILGIIRTWRLRDGKPIFGIATNMNGFSDTNFVGYELLRKYTISKKITFQHEKSDQTETYFPYIIYMVKNCEKENEGPGISELTNQTNECQKNIDKAQRLGNNVKIDHEKFLKGVQTKKAKRKIKIALGCFFGLLCCCMLVAGLFLFVRYQKKKKSSPISKSSIHEVERFRGSVDKKLSSAKTGSQLKLADSSYLKKIKKTSINKTSSNVSAKEMSRKGISTAKKNSKQFLKEGSKKCTKSSMLKQLSKNSLLSKQMTKKSSNFKIEDIKKKQLSRKIDSKASKKKGSATDMQSMNKLTQLQRSSNPKITRKSTGSFKVQPKQKASKKKGSATDMQSMNKLTQLQRSSNPKITRKSTGSFKVQPKQKVSKTKSGGIKLNSEQQQKNRQNK